MTAASGSPPGFTLSVSQNRYLFRGDRTMHAIVSVHAPGRPAPARPAGPAAEVILVDTSGSMNDPPDKIVAARLATRAAIDTLPDGTRFAVVAGTATARMVYPPAVTLAVAATDTRAEAKAEVSLLEPDGGTAMGRWLTLAARLLRPHRDAARHALLLTDGRNEHEDRAQLDEVLAACAGQFSCDARGVGEAWEPEELLHIAACLNGRADAVRDLDAMADDFRAVLRASTSRLVPDVDLRLRLTGDARLRFVRQRYPTDADMTPQCRRVDEMVVEVPTGAWGPGEIREYEVCVRIDQADRPVGQDTLAVRVDLVVHDPDGVAGPPPAAGLILAHWTADPTLSTQLDGRVAHYSHQEELGEAVRLACAALRRADHAAAETWFGKAVNLAARSGNDEVLTRLARLVEWTDPQGPVRVRSQVSITDLFSAQMASVRTTHGQADPAPARPAPDARILPCPECGFAAFADDRVCENCSADLTGRFPEPPP